MSSIDLKVTALEESSIGFGIVLTGLNDEAVTPNDVNWKYTDSAGTVINSRSAETETPASTTGILLYGDDLVYDVDTDVSDNRILTIWGTYDTTFYGSAKTNVPYKTEYKFKIRDLVNIPLP